MQTLAMPNQAAAQEAPHQAPQQMQTIQLQTPSEFVFYVYISLQHFLSVTKQLYTIMNYGHVSQ